MRLWKKLYEKLLESCKAVLPICGIVALLAMTLAPLSTGVFALFVIGSILLVFGMGLFTLGAEMSMTVIGEEIGEKIAENKNLFLTLSICFVLGFIVTIAEPDLTVLATQVPSIPNHVLIIVVGVGVAFFLAIGQLRNIFHWKLNTLLIIFYSIVFLLVIFVDSEYIPVAFDSAGVTTGPITVPFIMAFGVGLARLRSDADSSSDAFGLISLCSIGPVLAVLLLSIFYSSSDVYVQTTSLLEVENMQMVGKLFLENIPKYIHEVLIAFLPLVGIFVIFQSVSKAFGKHACRRIVIGYVYTFVGLVLFLTAANVGFMSAGELIGEMLASKNAILLIPIGACIGYFIVKAEPAVIVLTHQVEEISNGAIPSKSIAYALSIGIAISIGCAMIRVITGISILWFLIPGYGISLLLSYFVPHMYTGIAFDSGGVASGPMTATFLLPFAMGACNALGGNIMKDAFGVVALVALTPLITIQVLGFITMKHTKKSANEAFEKLCLENESVVYFEDEIYE